MRRLFALVLAAASAIPSAAQSEEKYTPGMVAYYNEAAQKMVDARDEHLDHYRAAPLEDLAGHRTEVLRGYYRNAFGSFSPLVQFERAPGKEPRVVVTHWDGARPVMEAPISGTTWDRLVAESLFFEREFVALPPPPSDADYMVICTDGLTMLVEAIDRHGTIRRKARNSCMDDLSLAFGVTLASEAVAALPACSMLDERFGRGVFDKLSACSRFEGDRSAAAEIVNLMGEVWLYGVGWIDDTARYRGLFASDAVARIEGFAETRGGISDLWAHRLPEGAMYYDRVIGHSASHVTVVGTIVFHADNEDEDRTVQSRLEWIKDHNGDFVITLIEAGATIGEPGSGVVPDKS